MNLKLKSSRVYLLLFILFLGCIPGLYNKVAAQGKAFTDTTLLFEPDRDGYAIMHVPAIIISKKGTLLAFTEGRMGNGGDYAEMDLLLRRSTNKGKSWKSIQVVIPREKGKPTSNITPIADKNGTIHLLYHVNYANAFYIQSKDEGKSWSKPIDITSVFNAFKSEYNWKVLATGPGHGIQLRNGRLVVPVWLSVPNPKIPGGNHRPSCVATIYSDDHGLNWKRGEIIANHGDLSTTGQLIVNPNESTSVELADGRVMINMRNESAPNRRLVSYSSDGATNWSTPKFDLDLFEPVCMGSICRISGAGNSGTKRILFVNPDSRNNAVSIRKGQDVYKPRENVTASLSYDEGETWPVKKVLHAKGSGYSDITVGPDGMIYCIYEIRDGSDDDWKYRMVLRRFNLEWLTDGKDTWKR